MATGLLASLLDALIDSHQDAFGNTKRLIFPLSPAFCVAPVHDSSLMGKDATNGSFAQTPHFGNFDDGVMPFAGTNLNRPMWLLALYVNYGWTLGERSNA